MSDKKFTFTISLNEPQLATLRLMSEYANFHTADVILRKDGREHFFEADWLREMLKTFKDQSLKVGDLVHHKHKDLRGRISEMKSSEWCKVEVNGEHHALLVSNLERILETNIRINAMYVTVTRPELSYRDIVDLAYGKDCQLLMTVAWQAGDRMSGGCLAPNDPPIPVTPGMVISAYHTGNA
jgi:hypothetical protein